MDQESPYYFRPGQERVYGNNEVDNVIRQLQQHINSSGLPILKIELCEIYRENTRYNPYTIPIKLLYFDVDANMQLIDEPRLERIRMRELREQEARVTEQERQQRRRNPTEADLESLLTDPFFRQEEDFQGDAVNPDPLQIVEDQELLNKSLTSFVWPGQCQICLEPETEDLCRVNCAVGHIFHCACINQYRNNRTIYGWNNKCPVCRTDIAEMVKVPEGMSLPMEFGKRHRVKLTVKQLKADIIYLNKK